MEEKWQKINKTSLWRSFSGIRKVNEQVVVLDADLTKSTKTALLQKEFANRHINVGISEADLMAMAAGRAFDQIRNSIAYPKLNVKITPTHSRISVGEDGGSLSREYSINESNT